jgi:exonuclease VII small subunit
MKSKSFPADIKNKSIKEAQDEIKEIINDLENPESDLEKSISKYNRMMHLNYHIQEEFKKKLKKIKDINLTNPKAKNKKFN